MDVDQIVKLFETEKVIYGLTKIINTNNPICINFIEIKHMFLDIKQCRNWKNKWRFIFDDLIWNPTYFPVYDDSVEIPPIEQIDNSILELIEHNTKKIKSL